MKREIAILIVAAAASSTTSSAQTPTDLGIGQRMKQNSEALQKYSYKRRTEFTIKGQTRGARVDQVHYVDGKMETTPLETPARASQPSRRGLRGKIVEKKIEQKKEEMSEERERLEALLHQYLAPGSDSMRALIEKATISRTGPGPDADVKVVGKGISKPSDSFTLVWSVMNHRPVSIEIQAQLDGKPVRVTQDYADLKDGIYYAAHTTLAMPAKDTVVRIETFDYKANQEPGR